MFAGDAILFFTTADFHLQWRHVGYLRLFFFYGATAPQWAMASSFTSFLDHKQRRTTVSRTPLDEWSARRRYLYLTTQNTHNRQTSMPPVGFEPTISAGERPQTYALDRAATGPALETIASCYIVVTNETSDLTCVYSDSWFNSFIFFTYPFTAYWSRDAPTV